MSSIDRNRITRHALLALASCAVMGLDALVQAGTGDPCGVGDCFAAHPLPGCGNPICCQATCFVDPFCCEQSWDALCAQAALDVCRQMSPSPTCPADFNGDDLVNTLDLGTLLASWSIPSGTPGCHGVTPCPPDLDGSGSVNSLDLGILLANWGACPAPTGACCLGLAGCSVMDQQSCELAGGHFGVEGSTCITEPHLLDELPAMVRLYTAATPAVTASSVAATAASVFGFAGAVTEDSTTITVSSGGKSLVVYKASGVLDYEDSDKLWNPEYQGPPPAMTEAQAIEAATVFLRTNGLMPPHQTITSASLIHVNDKAGGKSPNHWGVHFVFILPVTDEASMLSPILVQGGDIYVHVGDGEIIGLYRMWRDLTPGELVPARTIPELLEVSKTLQGFEPNCPMGFSMRYRQLSEEDSQSLLVPEVIVTSGHGHGDGLAVPATTLSPWVSITSPVDAGPQLPGKLIVLSAEVIGGTGPYEFTWTDQLSGEGPSPLTDPEGALSHSNPATVALRCGSHTINVRVGDASGLSASATIVVIVAGTAEQCEQALGVQDGAAECGNPAAGAAMTTKIRGRHGWSMDADTTADDGIRLLKVTFRGRMLAHSMLLPFYSMETQQMPLQAAELKHPAGAAANGNCMSTLQDPGIEVIRRKDDFAVRATWCIEKLPNGAASGTMTLRQSYWFEKETAGCAPLDVSACARYWPYVSYEYYPPAQGPNNFVKIFSYQRFDFDVPSADICGYHKDPDGPAVLIPVTVPAPNREGSRLMANMGVAGFADNYHQRDARFLVGIPGCSGVVLPPVMVWVLGTFFPPLYVAVPVPQPPWPMGDWSCTHVHWRWDSSFVALGAYWGGGLPLCPATQRAYADVVLRHPNEIDTPGLVAPSFFIAGPGGIGGPEAIGPVANDLVMWQEVESRKSPDVISQNHWFFR